jgi:hypothetical protein
LNMCFITLAWKLKLPFYIYYLPALYQDKNESTTYPHMHWLHPGTPKPGWPEWAYFRPLGNYFPWAVFWKSQKEPKFSGYFYSTCINFDENGFDYNKGDFFTNSSGTYDFFKYFLRKFQRKKLAFLTHYKAKFWKFLSITLVFEKNAIFFAENWQKSQKIVIICNIDPWSLWPKIICERI